MSTHNHAGDKPPFPIFDIREAREIMDMCRTGTVTHCCKRMYQLLREYEIELDVYVNQRQEGAVPSSNV